MDLNATVTAFFDYLLLCMLMALVVLICFGPVIWSIYTVVRGDHHHHGACRGFDHLSPPKLDRRPKEAAHFMRIHGRKPEEEGSNVSMEDKMTVDKPALPSPPPTSTDPTDQDQGSNTSVEGKVRAEKPELHSGPSTCTDPTDEDDEDIFLRR
ncbi:hypothetical protein R1flu_013053 [Riccia fluitans]|uniref:Uncharacterized protein n=1 Tax=Riccia fluitans TaxID=41844 RepID=A0ABD1ZCP6_9MARC